MHLFKFSPRLWPSRRGRSVEFVKSDLREDAPGKLGSLDVLVGAVDAGAVHVRCTTR